MPAAIPSRPTTTSHQVSTRLALPVKAAVEYHWLEGQYDRLPSLMADLVRRRVAMIATSVVGHCGEATP
jgi:hypothetical protein